MYGLWGAERGFALLVGCGCWLKPTIGWSLDKSCYKVEFRQKPRYPPVSVFRVFDLLFIHIKPYESELSTALYKCKAVARCATRKTNTAINRIKTVGAHKLRIENTYNRKQNKNRWGLQITLQVPNCITLNIGIIKYIYDKSYE